MSFTLGSAPYSKRSFTTSRWPFNAAKCSGVLPSFLAFGFAPFSATLSRGSHCRRRRLCGGLSIPRCVESRFLYTFSAMPWGLCGGGSQRRPPGLSPCVHRGDRRGGVRDATSTTPRLHRTTTPSDVDKGRCIPRGEAPPSPVSEFRQASPCRWERWQVPTPQLKDARGTQKGQV